MEPHRHPDLDEALREEREFVFVLGGFAIEIPGATLVTNERIPAPRFNFVQDVRLSRERIAGFFERSLDHYFQRALRPVYEVPEPAPKFLADVLERYGFRPRDEPRSLLVTRRTVLPPAPPTEIAVRVARPTELDAVADFWTATEDRQEVRRSLEVTIEHPNPQEALLPVLALEDGRPVSAAILHRFETTWGIHAVATQPDARGRGAASAIVAAALRNLLPPSAELVAIWADHARIRKRLELLGFHEIARYRLFDLDPKAELHLPPLGPPTGPRWRPPRSGGHPGRWAGDPSRADLRAGPRGGPGPNRR